MKRCLEEQDDLECDEGENNDRGREEAPVERRAAAHVRPPTQERAKGYPVGDEVDPVLDRAQEQARELHGRGGGLGEHARGPLGVGVVGCDLRPQRPRRRHIYPPPTLTSSDIDMSTQQADHQSRHRLIPPRSDVAMMCTRTCLLFAR